MNACRDQLADLVDAAEGRPAPELEAHLQGCPDCRARLTELKEGLERLAPGPSPAPGPWLAARVRAQAEARKVRRVRGLILGSGVVAVAGAFLVMMGWSASDRLEPVAASPEVWAAVERDLDRDPARFSLTGELPFERLTDVDAEDLRTAESQVYGLEAGALDPTDYDPFAPTLGLDLDAELAGASDAELNALLEHLPG